MFKSPTYELGKRYRLKFSDCCVEGVVEGELVAFDMVDGDCQLTFEFGKLSISRMYEHCWKLFELLGEDE